MVIDEIGSRLLEHLDPIRLEPRRILDIGAGTGTASRQLARRYRGARVYAVDLAWPMLREARAKARKLFSRQAFVCGEAERLPLGDACVELIYCNAMLPWCESLDSALGEFARVMRPGGLVMFTTFGPDTLGELRECWTELGGHGRSTAFLDMHDVGDALMRVGFTDVVMETERLTVQYPRVSALLQDLRASGALSVQPPGRLGLRGQDGFAAACERYDRLRTGGSLPATCEVVYAHAWKPESRACGPVPVAVAPPRLR